MVHYTIHPHTLVVVGLYYTVMLRESGSLEDLRRERLSRHDLGDFQRLSEEYSVPERRRVEPNSPVVHCPQLDSILDELDGALRQEFDKLPKFTQANRKLDQARDRQALHGSKGGNNGRNTSNKNLETEGKAGNKECEKEKSCRKGHHGKEKVNEENKVKKVYYEIKIK